ncbi:DUF5701 family protein [Actinotalea sp. K2]|uniref:DUF5701 family protein n=1 Tax=Actinotalea sp. K2 TaxID=2939438 RepID=UPI002017B2E0|nr:DUF5701 family protein [Actinotalea sp. K2]MCL3861408.1 DUF5701 family protein [Actinotalea sp. K2]
MPTTITAVDPDLPTVRAATPDLPVDLDADPRTELRRQTEVYLALGLPELLGVTGQAFRSALLPLADLVEESAAGAGDAGADRGDAVPFVLVLTGDYDLNDAVPAMRRAGRTGVSVIDREELATYRDVAGVEVPGGGAYLLTGIDTGSNYCGTRPEDALLAVRAAGRTPLTITEGVALTILRPDMLRPNRCYSLMGSRATNQRVPAVWISDRRAKLGWCWDRNPHTWLGAASARDRVAAG